MSLLRKFIGKLRNSNKENKTFIFLFKFYQHGILILVINMEVFLLKCKLNFKLKYQ